MAVLTWLHKAGRGVLDLLYPPRCAGCGQPGLFFCPSCLQSVSHLDVPLCPHCGNPQPGAELCPSCAQNPLALDGIRSVAHFDGSLRKAIHAFKYNYVRELAEPLGDLLVSFWARTPLPADILIPVPLHSRRQRERGYNQSALLALVLGRFIATPVGLDVVVRRRYTVSQVGLNAQQRQKNVADAFAVQDKQGVRDKRVVLIDDVCTTGSTLDAVSRVLSAYGAVSVWGLTLARGGV